MNRMATISPCGRYRYWLTRTWDAAKPLLVVVMLNPSTADERRDDPTLLALIHFATLWGYGGLIVVNLNAFRATMPSAMIAAHKAGVDVAGPENDYHLSSALGYAQRPGNALLVAWGTGGDFRDAAARFATEADVRNVKQLCLGRTLNGSPKHPLARGRHRIPRDQQPQPWSWLS